MNAISIIPSPNCPKPPTYQRSTGSIPSATARGDMRYRPSTSSNVPAATMRSRAGSKKLGASPAPTPSVRRRIYQLQRARSHHAVESGQQKARRLASPHPLGPAEKPGNPAAVQVGGLQSTRNNAGPLKVSRMGQIAFEVGGRAVEKPLVAGLTAQAQPQHGRAFAGQAIKQRGLRRLGVEARNPRLIRVSVQEAAGIGLHGKQVIIAGSLRNTLRPYEHEVGLHKEDVVQRTAKRVGCLGGQPPRNAHAIGLEALLLKHEHRSQTVAHIAGAVEELGFATLGSLHIDGQRGNPSLLVERQSLGGQATGHHLDSNLAGRSDGEAAMQGIQNPNEIGSLQQLGARTRHTHGLNLVGNHLWGGRLQVAHQGVGVGAGLLGREAPAWGKRNSDGNDQGFHGEMSFSERQEAGNQKSRGGFSARYHSPKSRAIAAIPINDVKGGVFPYLPKSRAKSHLSPMPTALHGKKPYL